MAGGRTTQSMNIRGVGPAQVSYRPGGGLASIHANGLNINHGLHGGRTIVTERNGRTIASTGPHDGYVQRPYFNRGGRSYYQRTYVRDGRSYSHVYREYNYRGVHYYGYVHDHYFHPGFYGWAYHPWGMRVYYGPGAWGWAGAPWFRFYGVYFTPYPVYASPAFWLTDYMIAANMQAAYQAGLQAGQASGPPPEPPPSGGPEATTQSPMSPEVKQAIADEVQRQLAAQQTAAANSQGGPTNPPAAPGGAQVPEALSPSQRVFVVASNLDVATPEGGQECSLTAGDVLMRITDQPDFNQNVNASVQSSKKGDCPSGQTVAVSVQDLQEMHNHFQEQLDSGLKTLADNSGKGGLPNAPDTGTTSGEVPAPVPDAGAADQLVAQNGQADQAESQVQQGGPPGS